MALPVSFEALCDCTSGRNATWLDRNLVGMNCDSHMHYTFGALACDVCIKISSQGKIYIVANMKRRAFAEQAEQSVTVKVVQ